MILPDAVMTPAALVDHLVARERRMDEETLSRDALRSSSRTATWSTSASGCRPWSPPSSAARTCSSRRRTASSACCPCPIPGLRTNTSPTPAVVHRCPPRGGELRQRDVVRPDPRWPPRPHRPGRPSGRRGGAAGQLDGARQDGAGHGRGDGSRHGRPARHRRHDAHRQGHAEDRRAVLAAPDLRPAR